ncbi:hypothetical protein FB451DRAFT_1172005 [Mycena latifolia]|nr:hypothetical protein FB451DRAFT_1172005 [Mycena latifolia]
MSHPHTPEQEAEALIADIIKMNKGHLDRHSYSWPSINYDQVSTETCETISSLINKKVPARGYLPVTPDTPRPVRIVRQINSLVTQRRYLTSKHIHNAQTLDEHIRKDLEPVFKFLRAAHRSETEQFNFPDPPNTLLEKLGHVRKALNDVEEMVRGNEDLDQTEASTDAGDPDETKVDIFQY